MFAASALLGTYAGFRQIVIDLRTVASRLRELGDGRILIDEHTAEVLAWDHAATAETFADIEPRFCAKVRGFDDDDPAPDRGYVVGLTVNGADKLVVVGADGSILGMTNGVTIDGLDRLGI